jgi:Coenzyme PQQ synthesis protein D (PqqD)
MCRTFANKIHSQWLWNPASATLPGVREIVLGKAVSMKVLADSIRRTSNADGGIVLDLRRGGMFRVNALGSRILDLLDAGEPLPRIAEQISDEFGVGLDVVQADIKEFLDSLEFHGVLERRGPNA